MQLLLADDSSTLRIVVTKIIQQWGYDPIVVEDGEAAWAVMQQPDPPRLLLVDWMMPHLDGVELCRRIRAQQSNNPPYIILLTSRSTVSDLVQGLEAGANDYITKPFHNAELKARLQVAKQMLELQGNLIRVQQQLTYERGVIEKTILKMRSSQHLDLTHVTYLQSSVEKTAGDLLLSSFRPDGAQHILVGDFTGHGLTAAIGGPIAADIFYSMTAKGRGIAQITQELNAQIHEKLPTGLFLAAILLELNPSRDLLTIWNCSMPEVLLFRDQKLLLSIPSTNVAFGIVTRPMTVSAQITVQADDRLFAYSDGMTETMDQHQQQFGKQRLIDAITHMLTAQLHMDLLTETVQEFRGGDRQTDDITLMHLCC